MSNETNLPQWPDPNKLMFRKVDRRWNKEKLFEQKGWFPLADVMKKLDPSNTGKYRKILTQRDKLTKMGQDTYANMGLKQYGSRIWADMSIFAKWYPQNEAMWLERIPKSWNLDEFLSQKKGVFSLNRVLQLVPEEERLKYPTMTNLIGKEQDSKQKIGADRVEGVGYVVFMPRFGEWLRNRLRMT